MGKSTPVTADSTLLINADAFNQMFTYAQYAHEHFSSEIAGWAHYDDENGIYKLAPLTKQEASGAEVDNFPNDILEKPDYDISDMMVQWHSHVNMNVFWSHTDEQCIKETLELTKTLVSVVVNIFGEYKCRVDSIVIGRQGHMVNLNKQITQNCILQPYYENPSMEKTVLKCLKKPQPAPIQFAGNYYGPAKRWDNKKNKWVADDDKEGDSPQTKIGTDMVGMAGGENQGNFFQDTYAKRQRQEFIKNYNSKIDELFYDSITDSFVFVFEGFDDKIIEWGVNAITVNGIEYTFHQLKKVLKL